MASASQRPSGPSKSSMTVFRAFLSVNAAREVDASRIHSKECFDEWVASRNDQTSSADKLRKTFQRTLTATLSGSDGRVPFAPEEEVAILQVLREKRVWPCFADTPYTIGAKGYRSFGFHERARLIPENASDAPTRKFLRRSESSSSSQRSRGDPGSAAASPHSVLAQPLPPSPRPHSMIQLDGGWLPSPAYPFLPASLPFASATAAGTALSGAPAAKQPFAPPSNTQ